MKTDLPQYWAVVAAAGVGKRMEASVPKQYLPLHHSTVIDVTLHRLLTHSDIAGVVIALSDGDQWWPDSEFSSNQSVTVVAGGQQRCHSVLNALSWLLENASAQDWVLVHDAARPCVQHEDITRLISAVGRSRDGGLLGVPVKDTMKRVNDTNMIKNSVTRDNLWHAFTPQLFPLMQLHSALSNAIKADKMVTDDASAMELAGFHPLLVEGKPDNLKITRPEDLALANFYLHQQLKQET